MLLFCLFSSFLFYSFYIYTYTYIYINIYIKPKILLHKLIFIFVATFENQFISLI